MKKHAYNKRCKCSQCVTLRNVAKNLNPRKVRVSKR